MKREMRRVGAPPREPAKPHIRYLVPRHQWPAAWEQLSVSRCAFATGVGDASAAPEPGPAQPIEVFVAARGAAILERLGAQLVGAGAAPWAALPASRNRVADLNLRTALDDDPLGQAFRAEAARVHAAKRRFSEGSTEP